MEIVVPELTLKFTVGENLPISAWLVAVVELSERFTFYGCQGLFQNYIQRPLDGSLGRGALGMGHQKATALNTFFSLWCYGMTFDTQQSLVLIMPQLLQFLEPLLPIST